MSLIENIAEASMHPHWKYNKASKTEIFISTAIILKNLRIGQRKNTEKSVVFWLFEIICDLG